MSGKPLKDVITGIKRARRPLTLEFEKDISHLDEMSAIAVLKQTKASGQEQHRMTSNHTRKKQSAVRCLPVQVTIGQGLLLDVQNGTT